MLRIRDLKETVDRLEPDLKKHVSDLSLSGTRGKKSSEFDFFKKTLLMEIKRSRRYRYPVAFLLVGVDGFREKLGPLEPARQQEILTQVLTVVAGGIRDIDLAVPFTDGRFLVFLPHTARKGAGVVAGRLRERLVGTGAEGLTASVGVAAYEPKHAAESAGPAQTQVSFGSLMKEATDALAKAQVLGGNRIETGETTPRSRISMG
jgi:PleD family two-component response regulator